MINQCKTCRFWSPMTDYPENGDCRRHAPEPASSRNSGMFEIVFPHWPQTSNIDWCGEWMSVAIKTAPKTVTRKKSKKR